tara:strand:+ start:5763 stop:6266 length:504 start_codon:yes stop_codon:yes gene_type:complete
VFPLLIWRQVAKFAPQKAHIYGIGVGETIIGVHACADLLAPLIAKSLYGVGMAIEIDNAALSDRSGVVRIQDRPSEITELVKVNIGWVSDTVMLNDHSAQILKSRTLVIAQATSRIATGLRAAINIVCRNPNGLGENLCGERTVAKGQFRDFLVECRHVAPVNDLAG